MRGVELAGESGAGVIALSATRAEGDAFLAMPFDEAVQFFRDKHVISEAEFDALRDRFRAGGFIARRLATERLRQVARDSIQRLLEQGLTIPECVQQIRDAESDASASLGITPVSSSYLDNVIRTNVATAYGAGRWQAMTDPNVVALRPWQQFRTAGDNRVRSGHRALNGLVFASGSELAARYAPPLFYQCFPGETVVQGRFDAAYRALYDGEILEITTKHGRRLSVTPNHPVATPRGFVPASAIREGDHLFGYEAPIEAHASSTPKRANVDEENAPARIDQVFRAIEESLAGARHAGRPCANDFDGDARCFDGDVDVVAIEGALPNRAESGSNEHGKNLVFSASDVFRHAGERGQRALRDLRAAVNAPARGSVSGGGLSSGDGWVGGLELRPLQSFRFGPASRLDTGLEKSKADRDALHVEIVRDLLLRVASDVSRNDRCGVDGEALPADVMPRPLQAPPHGSLGNTEARRNRSNGLPGVVSLDEVTRVERRAWSGHVYDLQSPNGWIVAEGIVTSNCRCVMVTLSARQFAERQLIEQTTRVDGCENAVDEHGRPEEFWSEAPAPLADAAE